MVREWIEKYPFSILAVPREGVTYHRTLPGLSRFRALGIYRDCQPEVFVSHHVYILKMGYG